MREWLTNYSPVDEVWFDGACGEGPNGKKHSYDWPSYYALIRELQPKALIAISGPDIRWVGNESGVAREDESSVVKRDGQFAWHPAECDISIGPGWFYHAAEDGKWRPITAGRVIGHKQFRCFPAVTAQRIRLVIEQAVAPPTIAEFGFHFSAVAPAD